jgi:regulator of replication initiation timing
MNEKSILNKVRTLLGLEVKLETMKLSDGVSMLEADAFEAGQPVFILTEDEQKIPLPIGEYELEDMRILVVIEEGVIAEVREAAEVEEEVVVEKAPEVEEEVEATTETAAPKKTIESIVKESFFSEIEALKKENEELKAKLSAQTTEVAEEVAPVELSEEPKPISFNPENTQATDVFKFAAKRNATTMDTVLSRISNIK